MQLLAVLDHQTACCKRKDPGRFSFISHHLLRCCRINRGSCKAQDPIGKGFEILRFAILFTPLDLFPPLLTPITSRTRSTLFFLFSLALLLQFRSYIPLFRDGLGEDAEVKKEEHISTETNTVIPRFRHLKSGHTTHH